MTTLGKPYLPPTDRAVLQAIEQIVVENQEGIEDPFATEGMIEKLTGHPPGVDALALERLKKAALVSRQWCDTLAEYRLTNDGWRYVRA